jgi:SIR2-like protein
MAKVDMAKRADFDQPVLLQKYLAKQLNRGRLALVLGAGISTAFKLPAWKELLQKLYASKGATPPKGADLKSQADHFRVTYFKGDKKGFIEAVRDTLYAGVSVNFEDLRRNATLGAIGSLVMASQRGSASNVITFNWDNLLELYLKYHGFVTLSASDERHWSGSADVYVLHPHGYIPYGSTEPASNDIVFDQTSYADVIGKEDRPWRQTLLTIMRTHTCLFIGLSGADDNLVSLLQTCKPQHASRKENTLFWGVTFTTSMNKAQADLWEEKGIYSRTVSNFSSELPELLFGICQEAANLRRLGS